MKHLYVGMLFVGCAALVSLGKVGGNDARTLTIDYSGAKRCVYLAEYTSQGTFQQKGTVSTKSTSLRCILALARKNQKQLTISVDSAAVVSDIFDEAMKKNVRESILKSGYILTITHGYPVMDTSAPSPVATYPALDLYRQLSKLLPALPEQAVKPGFTWERTMTMPLPTERGTVSCETYRSYTFKKIHGDTAIVTWQYSYAANKKTDNADLVKEIPVSGKGNGTAVLDIQNHTLLSASMDFTTPVAHIGDVTVTWTERAEFELLQCK
jgi:hypothetical protein